MFTYYNSKVTEERKARIERINEQVCLKKLHVTLKNFIMNRTLEDGTLDKNLQSQLIHH